MKLRPVVMTLACLGGFATARAASAATEVPYVGCETDVMGGTAHYAAPSGAPRPIPAGLSVALRLSFYQSLIAPGKPFPGLYGPRGWHCYGYMADGIGELVLSPMPQSAQYTGNDADVGASLMSISSDTGPGFTFAEQVMRAYFPQHLGEFLRSAGAATGNTFSKALSPPKTWSSDSIQQLGDWSALVTTPAHQEGFGTQSGWFAPGALPVETLIVVDSVDYWVYELRVRLASEDSALLPSILQAEPTEMRGR